MTDTAVEELMTTPVLTVEPDEPPADVARAMVDSGVKSVVVIDADCHPVGILTSTDYVRMTATSTDPHAATVGEFMTADVVTATAGEPVAAAADRMVARGISHLPVVDGGQVVGILTTTDLAASLVDDDG